MTEIPPETLAIAAMVTGHDVGCMCQRCDDVCDERTRPEGDYRPMVARLIAEVVRLGRVRDSLARRLGVRWGELEEARAALQQMTDERDRARGEAVHAECRNCPETIADLDEQAPALRQMLRAEKDRRRKAEAEVDRLRIVVERAEHNNCGCLGYPIDQDNAGEES